MSLYRLLKGKRCDVQNWFQSRWMESYRVCTEGRFFRTWQFN